MSWITSWFISTIPNPPSLPNKLEEVKFWFGPRPSEKTLKNTVLFSTKKYRKNLPPVPPSLPVPDYFPKFWYGKKPSSSDLQFGKDNLVLTPPNYPPPLPPPSSPCTRPPKPPPLPEYISIPMPKWERPTQEELKNSLIGQRKRGYPARNCPKNVEIRDLQWWAVVTSDTIQRIRNNLRKTKIIRKTQFEFDSNTVLGELTQKFKEKLE